MYTTSAGKPEREFPIMARRRKKNMTTVDLETIEATVVTEPVAWRRRKNAATVSERLTALVHQSYEDGTPIQFPIQLAGENTIKRDGSDSGIDRNVNTVVNAVRKAARAAGYGVKIATDVNPDEGVCYITFQAGELSRRPKVKANEEYDGE